LGDTPKYVPPYIDWKTGRLEIVLGYAEPAIAREAQLFRFHLSI
jgi:hypothetical protein